MTASTFGRRLLAPEVVQTSAMDCGPASLKCLLEGFHIPVSYGRLREACQTEVDGTSIDTMEDVARALGLDVQQVMVPADHVFIPEANVLPAIAVVRLPNGLTHFVVVWRMLGNLVQVMDPGTGRRWMSKQQLLAELFIHQIAVPAVDWAEWARTPELLGPLGRRMAAVGISTRRQGRLFDAATADAGWRSLAALDAATRMTGSLVRTKAIAKGRQARRLVEAFFEQARHETPEADAAIPAHYWSVRPVPTDVDSEPRLLMRGAVLIHASGRTAARQPSALNSAEQPTTEPTASSDLERALVEPSSSPWRTLFANLKAEGFVAPAAIVGALGLAAAGAIVEIVLLRGLLALGRDLGLAGQRAAAMSALLALLVLLLLLEFRIASGLLRFGRHLESRFRIAFLERIPRLSDRYFQSRLISDMAERSHSINELRPVPELAASLLRALFELLLTTAGIIWLDPSATPLAVAAAACAVGIPLAAQPVLVERTLRVRSHFGALGRFYLDALLGLAPVRAHGAERAVEREHESLLVEWAGASLRVVRVAVAIEGVQAIVGFSLAGWLLVDHLSRSPHGSGVLLLVYWALSLPVLGEQIALAARQYPQRRNVLLRMLEPLGSPTREGLADEEHAAALTGIDTQGRGVAVSMRGVSVRASGHSILEGLDLEIPAGSHVAIVGASGSGKSSLVGLLLGWRQAVEGEILVDGARLDGGRLERLRRHTAWVDPSVQLWNRSLSENLCYGSDDNARAALGTVLDMAELGSVLEKLPDGLQSDIGEGGALLSGGEGQRVRCGRALLRSDVRLAILDEAFRGLERERRRDMLDRARALWCDQTLLCITHDVGETAAFERVLVLEGGRVVEDGAPAELAQTPGSRYRALLDAEDVVRERMWANAEWQHIRLESGRVA